MLKDKIQHINGTKDLFRKNSKKEEIEKILKSTANNTIFEEEEEKEKDDNSPEKMKEIPIEKMTTSIKNVNS
jgi:hypothetical protein